MSLTSQLTPVRDELKEMELLILDMILGKKIVTFSQIVEFSELDIKNRIEAWYEEKIGHLFPELDLKNLIFYRISLAKKVAEVKYFHQSELFEACRRKNESEEEQEREREELMKLITHLDVEEKILERITNYVIGQKGSAELAIKVKDMFEDIILITKSYQVYFIHRFIQ